MSVVSTKSGQSPRRHGKVPADYGGKDLWKGRFWA